MNEIAFDEEYDAAVAGYGLAGAVTAVESGQCMMNIRAQSMSTESKFPTLSRAEKWGCGFRRHSFAECFKSGWTVVSAICLALW